MATNLTQKCVFSVSILPGLIHDMCQASRFAFSLEQGGRLPLMWIIRPSDVVSHSDNFITVKLNNAFE